MRHTRLVPHSRRRDSLIACCNLHGRSLRGHELRVGLAERSGQGGNRHDGGGEDELVGIEDATHAASLVTSVAARPHDAVTSYLAWLRRRQLCELLDALAAQEAALVEDTKRAFAGLATLIEQAWALLDMASSGAPHVAAGKPRHDDGGWPAARLRRPKLRSMEDGRSVHDVACH
ncbi:hypothetical protein ACP4OV_023536 [Aristida adscensionis]